MSKVVYVGAVLAVVLAYVLNLFVPIIWIANVASLPLLRIRKRYAVLSGFLIGLLVPLSLYLMYPIPMVGELSGIMGQLAGLPPFLVVVVFPLFYGIIMRHGGLFWSGLAENLTSR